MRFEIDFVAADKVRHIVKREDIMNGFQLFRSFLADFQVSTFIWLVFEFLAAKFTQHIVLSLV